MARYRATVDCVIFGAYRPAGSEFEGPELEGYDKETAAHLEFLDEDAPSVDLSKMKVDELMELAKAKGIEIPKGTPKAQLVEWLKAAPDASTGDGPGDIG